MAGRIATEEAETYRQVWGLNGYADYSPGERFTPIFLDLVQTHDGRYVASRDDPFERPPTVLDAGTGSGKGALALHAAGFSVTCCDCTAEGMVEDAARFPFHEVCLWSDLEKVGRHDWVFCCDVLEHLPPAFTMLTVHQLMAVAAKGVYLTIGLEPDAFGLWLGKSLHQTIQSFEVWKAQLSELGDVVEARDLITTGIYLLKAHR